MKFNRVIGKHFITVLYCTRIAAYVYIVTAFDGRFYCDSLNFLIYFVMYSSNLILVGHY